MARLPSSDLHVVARIAPDVLILEIGTDDLVDKSPEVFGSEIENLVRLLLEHYSALSRHCAFCHPKCLLLGT